MPLLPSTGGTKERECGRGNQACAYPRGTKIQKCSARKQASLNRDNTGNKGQLMKGDGVKKKKKIKYSVFQEDIFIVSSSVAKK